MSLDQQLSGNKDKILVAASRLLLEKGLSGLSVRAISQAAGLSTIAIYSHFKNKQGVLDALYVEGFRLVQEATESAADVADPVEAALLSGERYLDFANDHEGHYRLIFGETGSAYAPSAQAYEAARLAFDALVAQVTRLLPESASLGQRQRAALRLWALLHGYVSLRHHVIGSLLDYGQWKRLTMESFRRTAEEIRLSAGTAAEVGGTQDRVSTPLWPSSRPGEGKA